MKESADLKALMEFLFPRKRGYGGGIGKVANIILLPGKRIFSGEIPVFNGTRKNLVFRRQTLNSTINIDILTSN